MRRLNAKLLFSFLGGLVVLSGTVFAVHRLQAGNISDALLYQADQAGKENRPDQVARYLNRYLEFAPDDHDARARLGKTLADPRLVVTTRGRDRARFVLEQVLTHDPDRHEARRCLAKLLLDARYPDQAEEHLKYLQKARPTDPEVVALVSQWQELRGRPEEALDSLRKSVQSADAPAGNHVRLIGFLRGLDRGRRGKHFTEAERQLAEATRKAPEDCGVLLAAADLAQDRGELKEARTHVERAFKKHPTEGRVYLALGRLALQENKRPDALAALRAGIEAVPLKDRFELQWALANILLDGGDLDEGRAVTRQIQDNNPGPGAVDYLQARALMHQGRWFEASRLLEGVRALFQTVTPLAVQVELLLASCYERMEEPARQLAACDRAAQMDPDNGPAQQGKAKALWALGQTDAAILQYRAIVARNVERKAPVSGRVELARMLLLRAMEAEKADWRAVVAELDAAEKEQPGTPDVVLLRAELYAARKQYDEAGAVLGKALQERPKHVEFWTAAAGLADRKGEPENAHRLLDEAKRQAGDSVELRLARARLWAGRPDPDAVKALRRLEEKRDGFTPEQQTALLNGLAEANYRAGNPADAGRLWAELAKQPRNAQNLKLRLLLFDLAVQQKDDAAMQRLLDEIRTLEGGESPVWLFGQASRRLVKARQGDRKALAEARQMLDQVVAQRPAWPAVLLAQAEVEEMQGNVEQAITYYRRVIEQGVHTPRVVRQLVQLLTARQRYAEAEQELRKLRQLTPQFRRIAVNLRAGKGSFEDLLRDVDEAAPETSTDYRDHLWRGQVLSSGRRKSVEAEKALRRAVELADTKPETWVALVQYLRDTAQKDRAAAEIERARAKLTGPSAPAALAQCYELVGRPDRARLQYRAGLEAQPHDVYARRNFIGFCLRTGAHQEAEPHLRAILDRKVKATDADVAWARRGLALTLATTADHQRLPEALKLVGLALDAKGEPVDEPAPAGGWPDEDQVTRARVLATQTRRPTRTRAVAILEEIQKRKALAADDQLLLAQLYLTMGPEEVWWAKAREQLSRLVANHPRNPLYLSAYTQALLRSGDTLEADRIIKMLERVEKERQLSLGAAELRSRLLEARGKGEDALKVLRAYAEAPDATPDRALLCAGLEARLGRVKEAVDQCEQARKQCRPEAIGGAGVALLRAALSARGHREDVWRAQAARIEAWLKETLAAAPDNTTLRLQLADLVDLLGRPSDAEALYREVLRRTPGNHVALNNLAWLLTQKPGGAGEALKLVQQAIDARGPRAELLDTRAVAYLALGQADKAVADLEQAVADAPTPAKHFHLAQAHQKSRNTQAARQALQRATTAGLTAERLHPTEREAFQRLKAELQ